MIRRFYPILCSSLAFALLSQASGAIQKPEIKRITGRGSAGAIYAVNGKQEIFIEGKNFHPQAKVTLADTRTGEEFNDRHYKGQKLRYNSFYNEQLKLKVNFTDQPAEWTVEIINPGHENTDQISFSVVSPPENYKCSFESEEFLKADDKDYVGLRWIHPLGETTRVTGKWLERGEEYDKHWRDYHTEGIKRIHAGIDLAAQQHTPVYAIADGTVIRIIQQTVATPGCLMIRHQTQRGAFVAIYGHMDTELKANQTVGRGEQIGAISHDEDHLHFGIAWGGEAPEIDINSRYGWGAIRAEYFKEHGIPNGLIDPIAWLETQSPIQ